MVINQYEIYWTDLNPSKGSEIEKIRQCMIPYEKILTFDYECAYNEV